MVLVDTGFDRKKTLQILWKQHSDRKVYNKIKKDLSFKKRRPTDYRHNKRLKLPRSLKADLEFYCEFKRRKFMESYRNYKQDFAVDNNKKK